MKTTRISSKGQVIIPKPMRTAHRWKAGQKLVVVDMGDGVLLRPIKAFDETDITEAAACLRFRDKPRSIDDMDAAISKGVRDKYK